MLRHLPRDLRHPLHHAARHRVVLVVHRRDGAHAVRHLGADGHVLALGGAQRVGRAPQRRLLRAQRRRLLVRAQRVVLLQPPHEALLNVQVDKGGLQGLELAAQAAQVRLPRPLHLRHRRVAHAREVLRHLRRHGLQAGLEGLQRAQQAVGRRAGRRAGRAGLAARRRGGAGRQQAAGGVVEAQLLGDGGGRHIGRASGGAGECWLGACYCSALRQELPRCTRALSALSGRFRRLSCSRSCSRRRRRAAGRRRAWRGLRPVWQL